MFLKYLLESDQERHHDDNFFTNLLSVIERLPELKIKAIELVANLARQGMLSSLYCRSHPWCGILTYDNSTAISYCCIDWYMFGII